MIQFVLVITLEPSPSKRGRNKSWGRNNQCLRVSYDVFQNTCEEISNHVLNLISMLLMTNHRKALFFISRPSYEHLTYVSNKIKDTLLPNSFSARTESLLTKGTRVCSNKQACKSVGATQARFRIKIKSLRDRGRLPN